MLRATATWFLRRGAFDLALALAAGYALVRLVDAISELLVDALAQHLVHPSANAPIFLQAFEFQQLSFRVGGTTIVYGPLLASLLTLVVVAAVVLVVQRARRRVFAPCPFCCSPTVRGASVCPACGSDLAATG
jgi:large-conductance mechanosensitive channel